MAWTAPKTFTVGELIADSTLNAYIRDNLLALSAHAHGGAAGDGNDELSGVDSVTFDDITTPSAPGDDIVQLYSVGGVPTIQYGATPTEVAISDENHTH